MEHRAVDSGLVIKQSYESVHFKRFSNGDVCVAMLNQTPEGESMAYLRINAEQAKEIAKYLEKDLALVD